MKINKFPTIILIFMIIHSTMAQTWTKANGIPSDISITSLQNNDGKYIAFGMRMWREGTVFKSEPKSYVSNDGGKTWEKYNYIETNNIISTVNSFFISNNRILTSGRKGSVQFDWIGALCFSDDNGKTWNEVEDIPSDISITQIQKNNEILVALGQKMRTEGFQILSEPRSFVSYDNGATWVPFVNITKELSTVNTLMINKGRIITSGRLGPTQMDWIGAIFFSDDNGDSWQKSKGYPSDIAFQQIQFYDDKLFAIGQKQWRDGYSYFSEPKLFISEDNGATWREYFAVTNELSSASSLLIDNGILITSGRLGPAQMDWVGGVFYTNIK